MDQGVVSSQLSERSCQPFRLWRTSRQPESCRAWLAILGVVCRFPTPCCSRYGAPCGKRFLTAFCLALLRMGRLRTFQQVHQDAPRGGGAGGMDVRPPPFALRRNPTVESRAHLRRRWATRVRPPLWFAKDGGPPVADSRLLACGTFGFGGRLLPEGVLSQPVRGLADRFLVLLSIDEVVGAAHLLDRYGADQWLER